MANIPADGPLAAVLASVPNTPEAREAALQAQIPHLATVSRSSANATVAYDGEPQFAPIDGTALSYAVNTSSDVIRVGDAYYLCQNGVWFTAAAPAGPWSVATAVPDPIYAIPPSSPLYNVTYVRLYQVAHDQVVDGYTDGYLGEYVADGVVTWGTGYYYPPYLAVGAAAALLPASVHVRLRRLLQPGQRQLSSRRLRLRSVRRHRRRRGVRSRHRNLRPRRRGRTGPTNRARRCRPTTRARAPSRSARAARIPMRRGSRASSTGRSGAARADSVSNDRGTVARVQTAGGAEVVAAGNGDRSAAAVRAPGGDWYAGGDGNIYQHTDTGWQRYDAPRADARPPGLGRAVGADGYVPSRPVAPGSYVPSHYVPSEPVNYGLNQEYAARQREMQSNQRLGELRQPGGSGGYGGGRFGRGGGGRR